MIRAIAIAWEMAQLAWEEANVFRLRRQFARLERAAREIGPDLAVLSAEIRRTEARLALVAARSRGGR